MRWPIESFHRDAKQRLGLEDYQVRKIKGVKRHIAMVFFAYVLLQLGSGFDRIMGNLKANLRTIGSRCRLAGTEMLSSLVRFVVKMTHRDMDAKKIMDLLTKPLERSAYCASNDLPKIRYKYYAQQAFSSCLRPRYRASWRCLRAKNQCGTVGKATRLISAR
jgi:hypothetical protein